MGGQRPLCEMRFELRAEKWEQLATVKTGLLLQLSVGEKQASHQSLWNSDLFHQNTNFFSKVTSSERGRALRRKFPDTPELTSSLSGQDTLDIK